MIPKFSVIVLFNQKKIVKNTLLNILKENKKNNIEIILLDKSKKKNEELEKIINSSSRIIHINGENLSDIEALNMGLECATGQYITFIEQGTIYDSGVFEKVKNVIEKNESKIVCVKPIYFNQGKKKKYKICPKDTKKVDLTFTPFNINMAFDSYFINKNLLKNERFDTKLCLADSKIKFLLNVLLLV